MIDFPSFPTSYWASNSPARVAIVWKRGESDIFPHLPEQISWLQWQQLVEQAAFHLQQLGVKPNQVVAYSGQHRLIGLLCYCATIAIGGIILGINPAMTASQREQLLQQNEIAFLVTDQHFAKLSQNPTACSLPSFDINAVATLTLTSGSSGKPKAVAHSASQHLYSALGVCKLMDFNAENRWLLSLPLFHVSGQGIVWRWLLKGATLVLGEDKQAFLPQLLTVSHSSLVPTQLQRYLNYLKEEKLTPPSQQILLGGAAIPAELIREAKLFKLNTFSGYGMTEMASTICAVEGDLDNVGKPLVAREVKIEQGEIWVRGLCLGLGYWQRGEITQFTNEQGWFQTKDCGFWNQNGQLVVKGRLDNLFISGGENIQPEQIEAVLFASNLLKAVFIVPVEDQEFGKRPLAFVDFINGFSSQAVIFLQDFAKQHLEKFKLPIAYLPFDLEEESKGGIKISRQKLIDRVAQLNGVWEKK